MPFKKYSKDEIEQMEILAKSELDSIQKEELTSVNNWWRSWYLKIGHRRLGRALLRSGMNRYGIPRSKSVQSGFKQSVNPGIQVEIDERFEFRSSELADGTIFACMSFPPKTTIVLNRLHPMHDSFVKQIESEILESDAVDQPLISLLVAWAEVELSHTSASTKEHMEQIRFDISRVVKTGRSNQNVAIIR